MYCTYRLMLQLRAGNFFPFGFFLLMLALPSSPKLVLLKFLSSLQLLFQNQLPHIQYDNWLYSFSATLVLGCVCLNLLSSISHLARSQNPSAISHFTWEAVSGRGNRFIFWCTLYIVFQILSCYLVNQLDLCDRNSCFYSEW